MFELSQPHKMMQDVFRSWCEKSLAPKVDAMENGEHIQLELMQNLMDSLGMRGMIRKAVTKQGEKMEEGGEGKKVGAGGGEGMDGMDDPLIGFLLFKEISRYAPGFAMSFGVSTGLCGVNIINKGSKEQVLKYGVPVMSVDKMGCWALTEPGAGSDAFGSMRTIAKPDGDNYILNGTKTFITNGPIGDIFLIYAKIDRGQSREDMPIQAFILEKGMEGLSTGTPFEKMGMKDSPTSEVFMDDVKVPKENILGGKEKTEGRKDTKESLGQERSGLPSMCLGIIERCYELSLKYSMEREQFGKPIGDYQAQQLRLARMYIHYQNVWNAVIRAAWAAREGKEDFAFTCAMKAYTAQAACEVALDAVMLHGGYGYMKEYHVEKLARDAKLLELGAGTTDINLLQVARLELERYR